MHYTGTVWRPPFESESLLIEVTAGCTHHKCKFCTLYHDLPFTFRMSPLEYIEADLQEAQMYLSAWRGKQVKRIFLVGANPFVLQFSRLKAISNLIRSYFPSVKSIGCFSRVTDISLKTDEELHQLHKLGYDGLSVGVETGDSFALNFMNKGYTPKDIILQMQRLDRAGISYYFTYLAGISGAGRSAEGAIETAKVFNLTHPKMIGCSMLTVYPNSELYHEIQSENWEEPSELEKLQELYILIQNLTIPVQFSTLGASNAVYVQGQLPQKREAMLSHLEQIIYNPQNEQRLRHYRAHLPHL